MTTPKVEPKLEIKEYSWAPNTPTKMIQNDEGFCFLTSVVGKFAGYGEQMGVGLEKDGFWYLKGQSQQPLGGKAVSVRSDLRKLFQTEVKEYQWQRGSGPIKMIAEKDGFCFLSFVAGQFQGGGEGVGVSVKDGSWQLAGSAVTPLTGKAVSFRTHKPGEFQYKIAEHQWRTGQSPVKMIKKSAGVAFLSTVAGGFHGGGEEVKIYLGDDGFWYLGGRSSQASTNARAISILFQPEK